MEQRAYIQSSSLLLADDYDGRKMMTDKLEMPLDKFAEAVAKENTRLISGPGGIIEMKQTIADKEKRIEQLETALRDISLMNALRDRWSDSIENVILSALEISDEQT
jgi:hypothetical protein